MGIKRNSSFSGTMTSALAWEMQIGAWVGGSKDKTGYILKVKRKSLEDEDEDESNPLEDEIATSLELKRSPYTYKSYKYRQPYMLPRRPSRTAISRTAYAPDKTKRRLPYSRRYKQPRYQPYRAYARYGAIPRPQGRQYAYASMADADWGWKKRSQLPALMGTNTEDAEEEVLANALDKRNLASLAKNNFFPREYKRSQDTDSDDSDVLEEEKRHVSSLNRSGRSAFEEEKRHVSSLNRSGRSASSLARSGELRGRK